MASSKLDLEAVEAASLLWWMGQGLRKALWVSGTEAETPCLAIIRSLVMEAKRDIAISIIPRT